ncbi:MAG: hypothetical protein HY096_00395 [Nitrospinae bacterium]|nr:hypothetical protein [Nitrospinota bacterium]
MTENDRTQFESILTAIAEIFDKQLSGNQLDLYFLALQDLNLEQFKKAGNVITQTSRFFPKPVDFREAVKGTILDKTTQAVLLFENAVRKYGYYDSVIFADKLIHACVEALGGWQEIYQDWGYEKWVWVRKDFEKHYEYFLKNPPVNIPERLIGFHEQNNNIRGYLEYISKPVLIGDGSRKEIAGGESLSGLKKSLQS